MRNYIFLLSAFVLGLSSCKTEQKENISANEPVLIKVNLLQENSSSRVDTYSLTSNSPDQDSIESRKIIELKMELLNAIEKQDSLFLDNSLHSSFSFVSGQSFYNKQDFIDQRLYKNFDVKNLKLENPTIQIVGKTAILSYIQANPVDVNLAKSFWTDIYEHTGDHWKLLAIQKF